MPGPCPLGHQQPEHNQIVVDYLTTYGVLPVRALPLGPEPVDCSTVFHARSHGCFSIYVFSPSVAPSA